MSQRDREGEKPRLWNRAGDYRDQRGRDERGYRDHGRGYRDHQGYRGERDQRFGRADRRVAREISLGEDEIRPMPNGRQCNPLCPYFRCNKKALGIVRRDVGGPAKFVAFCNWVNDLCIGGLCQLSSCEKFYLLPDNTCLYALKRERRSGEDDMMKELEEEEQRAKKLRGLISKKLGGRGFDLE